MKESDFTLALFDIPLIPFIPVSFSWAQDPFGEPKELRLGVGALNFSVS